VQLLIKTLLTLFISLILSSCGSVTTSTPQETPSITENTEPFSLASTEEINETQYFRVMAPKTCTQTNKNRFIYQVMHDSYLWADSVPELDYSSSEYNSSEKMLNALKSRHDKFSFIIDAKIIQSFFEEGKNDNFGMGLVLVPFDSTSYVLVVRFVYPNSPADKAGVKRSDIIKLVEGKPITKVSLDEIVQIVENQRSVNFSFLQQDNSTFNRSITKESYSIETLLYHNIFTNSDNSKIVGYMVFQDFIHNATEDIDNLFRTFKKANVNELILDLRYNGGGEVGVANHLSSLIGGSNVVQNIFNQVKFNDKYSKYNYIDYFEKLNKNALNLNRIFVITTSDTCSSSELVISSLRASANNIEVIQIGDTTCGKPYGYVGSGLFCDKALYAINEESQNGDGIGNYVNGFTPTCKADDNFFKAFGDTNEESLAQALNYISTGKCKKEKTQQKLQNKSKLQLPKNGFKRIMSAY